MKLSAIKPFIPSGKDFAASKAFFEELGFVENWQAEGCAELQFGDAVFILQALDNQVLQENFMVSVAVDDLDAFWQHLCDSGVLGRHPTVRAKPPTDYPWGNREVHLIDVAGVCWHFV
jgi:uncharacterized glyoxalase superfamily protein PhnB